MARRMLRMVVAVAVLFGVCAGAAFAAEAPAFLFGTLPAGKDAPTAVLKLVADKATVFTSRAFSTGFLGKHKFQTLIIGTDAGNRDAFIKTGLFKDLPADTTIRMTWSRVSDINGWGTEVNGEVHRRVNYEVEMKAGEIADGLALVKRLVKNNLAELQEITQEKYNWLMANAGVVAFERGFVVDFSLRIEVLSMADGGKWLRLYDFGARSGYYR